MSVTISVVIPCYNEARFLPDTLAALACQTLAPSEVLLIDGGSDDGTVEVALALAAELDLPLRVLTNPDRHIPHALNIGIAAALGTHIARLDGHSQPDPDYLAACVTVWRESGAALVGGAWQIAPGAHTLTAEAIATAARTPLGSGGAAYRDDSAAAHDADTVPFGFFEKRLWASLGGYDEALLTNEDYEFAARVRKAGGRVRFDPRIRCVYFARADFRALARQYWRYGWWKSQMLRRHPDSLKLRQAVPALWAGGSLILLVGSLLSRRWRGWAMGTLALYGGVLAAEAAFRSYGRRALWPRLGLAYTVIHYAWGLGALAGLLLGTQDPDFRLRRRGTPSTRR